MSLVARSASMVVSFYFVELGVDQLLDRVDGLLLVLAVGRHSDDRAAAGRQQQNAQDALAVDFFVAFANFDVRFVTRGAMDEFCGGASMQSQFVFDLDVARDQWPLTRSRSAGPPSPRSRGARALARVPINRRLAFPPTTDRTRREWPSSLSRRSRGPAC